MVFQRVKSFRTMIKVALGVGVGITSFVIFALLLFSLLYQPTGTTVEFPIYSLLLGEWNLTLKGHAFPLLATLFGALAGTIPMAVLTWRHFTGADSRGRLARLWVISIAVVTLWLCWDRRDPEFEQKLAGFRNRPTKNQNTNLIREGLVHQGTKERRPFDNLPTYEILKEDGAYLREHHREI